MDTITLAYMQTKECCRCGVVKSIDEFYKDSRHGDGLRSSCWACIGKVQMERYWLRRREVFRKLGNRCVQCGYDDERALQIDHINGGGNKERRKEFNDPFKYMRDILADTENKYQLLCANCNCIKRLENGENRRRVA